MHTCHARNCNVRTAPKMFMCKRHWYMLPKSTRDLVWAVYVPGQEQRKDPTRQYLKITQDAIEWLDNYERSHQT